jgi:hypothetical protein
MNENCRKFSRYDRKEFHLMTEPTTTPPLWDPALNEICPAYSEIRPA